MFDLGAGSTSATGEPKVELTYPDPTTLVVTMTGASASGATPAVGKSAIVSGLTAAPSPAPGTAVYRITMPKPGTGKTLFLSGPLRVVIDVTPS